MVGDQRPRGAPHHPRLRAPGLRGATVTVLPSTLASTMLGQRQRQLAELALGGEHAAGDRHLHARRDFHRIFANARHHAALLPPLRTRGTSDFAANIGSASLGIAHHAARRGQDRNAEAGIDPRQLLDLRIDAPARLGDARDLLDDRFAFVVFQLDAQLRHAGAQLLGAVAADEALALQHVQHVGAQLPKPAPRRCCGARAARCGCG